MNRNAATRISSVVGVVCLLGAQSLLAQFSSGSTGADGALNIAGNGIVTNLNLPPDGIFNFTTITIGSGATLKFKTNFLNTPVYLLATGDVVVTGTIDVSGGNYSGRLAGLGGPGGFDGGLGAYQGFPAGEGQGPGGGRPTTSRSQMGGVFGIVGSQNTNVYGNTLLSPLIGGSGGSAFVDANGNQGNYGGGGGGGAILIASSTRVTINGNITANGGYGNGGGGSGGGIRIVAPVIDGSGNLYVTGGISDGQQGFGGRTRLDSIDRLLNRNLFLDGKGTRGSQMFVFPPATQHLDIINAAGTAIPEGAGVPVTVTLPVGSSSNQVVRVQARGFTNDLPIRVKITPENAPSAFFDATILQSSGTPPFGDVQVTLPLDTVCHVLVWPR